MTGAAVGRMMIEIDGAGPPVVFVPGLGATSNAFQPLIGALGGFRCIRLDLPGSGRSPLPFGALSIESFVAAVGEAIAALAGGPVHLVGHSMGALVCQHVAAKTPEHVASLALFGPIVAPTDASRQRLKDRASVARREGMIGVADAVVAGGLSSASRNADPLLAAFVRESHMRQDPEGFAQSCEALAAAEGADLRGVRSAMLIVTGDEDSVAPPSAAQALADRVKRAKVKVLEHCGHWTPIERPVDCARLLAEHLRAQAA
jgi:pimeloyl-ACP methyl ester carboxylesterase